MELRPEVKWFAENMERKLRDNEHKGGWKVMTARELWKRVDDELKELTECEDEDFEDEAADVANFLMMLCDIRRVGRGTYLYGMPELKVKL